MADFSFNGILVLEESLDDLSVIYVLSSAVRPPAGDGGGGWGGLGWVCVAIRWGCDELLGVLALPWLVCVAIGWG